LVNNSKWKEKEEIMPKVGKKTFGYGAAGKKAAKTYAMKTGKKMTTKKVMPKKKK
tara:strand:+ start:1332 stop:1496 length:165 start_codon:yes stop_codon:yes gene_type:complete